MKYSEQFKWDTLDKTAFKTLRNRHVKTKLKKDLDTNSTARDEVLPEYHSGDELVIQRPKKTTRARK